MFAIFWNELEISDTFVTLPPALFPLLPTHHHPAFTFPEAADPPPKNFYPGFSGTDDYNQGDGDDH